MSRKSCRQVSANPTEGCRGRRPVGGVLPRAESAALEPAAPELSLTHREHDLAGKLRQIVMLLEATVGFPGGSV